MAGGVLVSTRRCGDGRFRRLDQRQGIANGKRMLGSRTPNFCDASSEFGGSTTIGLSNEDRRRRGVMRFVVLASRHQPGRTPALVVDALDQIGDAGLDRMPDRSEPGTVKHQVRRARQSGICLPDVLLDQERSNSDFVSDCHPEGPNDARDKIE